MSSFRTQAQIDLRRNVCWFVGECRPLSPEPYTLQFNGHLGRQIMDAELASEQADAESATAVPQARRVLMGHSLGAACAVAEAIAHPEVSSVFLTLSTLTTF